MVKMCPAAPGPGRRGRRGRTADASADQELSWGRAVAGSNPVSPMIRGARENGPFAFRAQVGLVLDPSVVPGAVPNPVFVGSAPLQASELEA